MNNKKRTVIIYSPLGVEHKYTTSKEMAGDEYKFAESIEAEPGYVNVVVIEDGKAVGRAYCMPYYFEMW